MITYDLLFENNRTKYVNYFCFGYLNGELPEGNEVKGEVVWDYNRNHVNLSEVIYYLKFDDTEKWFRELKLTEQMELIQEIIKSYRFLSETLVASYHYGDAEFHRETCVVVRAQAGVIPCDKTMFALMLIRNIVAQEGMSYMFKWCRDAGYSIKYSVFAACVATAYPRFGGKVNMYLHDADSEYCFFDSVNIGKQALLNFIKQEDGWYPWYQGNWNNQRRYHRDSDFDDRFNGRRRCFADALSIEGEEVFEFMERDNYDYEKDDRIDPEELMVTLEGLFVECGLDPRN